MGDPLPDAQIEFTLPLGYKDPLADDGQVTLEMFALRKTPYPPVEFLKAKINDTSRIQDLFPRAYRENVQKEYAIDASTLEERFLYAIANDKHNILNLYNIWRKVAAFPQIGLDDIDFIHDVIGYDSIYDGLGKDIALDNLFTDLVAQLVYFPGDPVRGNIDLIKFAIVPNVIDVYKKYFKKKG